jgi:erythromycin esterase-like protein
MAKAKINNDWLYRYSFQLQSTDPNAPLNDLKLLVTMIDSARIVGMGEATHGSKEFTLIRHRILKFLVEEMGFRGLILETPQKPAKAIDNYVKTGKGIAQKLLSDLGYWVHNTQEMLNVIEWMREYNLMHPLNQISFYGCDIPAEDERRNQESSIRDKAMAENCLKTLEKLGSDAKLALWSHNFHIYYSGDLDTQGKYLKESLGKSYFALISLFNEGEFNAFLWDKKAERTKGFQTFDLHASHKDTYEHMFAETKLPLAIFDIQKVAKQARLQKDQLKKYTVREVGSVFTPDDLESFEYQNDLFSCCDGVIWFNKVTASTSLWQSAPTNN